MEAKVAYYNWHRPDQALGEILRTVDNADRVLDIGCGTGWVLDALETKGVRSIGLDLDIHALNAAPNAAAVVCGSVTELPLNNESFDLVIAKDILEHILRPEAVVKEIARVLRTNGKLWVSVPHAGSPHFWDDYTHIRPFTLHGLRALLEDHGFKLDSFCYSGSWPGVGWVSRRRGHTGVEPIVKALAKLGIRRHNILALAHKNG